MVVVLLLVAMSWRLDRRRASTTADRPGFARPCSLGVPRTPPPQESRRPANEVFAKRRYYHYLPHIHKEALTEKQTKAVSCKTSLTRSVLQRSRCIGKGEARAMTRTTSTKYLVH